MQGGIDLVEKYATEYRKATGAELDLESNHPISFIDTWVQKEHPELLETPVFDWPEDVFQSVMAEIDAYWTAEAQTGSLFA